MPMNMSETELLILKYLWNQNSAQTFSEIMTHFTVNEHKNWAKQTLNTFLLRLTKKGFLKVSKVSGKKQYEPVISSEEYYQRYAHDIVDESFDSSLKSFVCAFTGNQHLSQNEKEELIEYLKGL